MGDSKDINEFVRVWEIDYDPQPLLDVLKWAPASNKSYGILPGTRGNAEQGELGWNERLVQELVKKCPDAGEVRFTYIRTIEAGKTMPKHNDIEVAGYIGRFHWPLVTTPDVLWVFPDHDITFHMEVGKVYRVNARIPHQVINLSSADRTHLIMDKFINFVKDGFHQ